MLHRLEVDREANREAVRRLRESGDAGLKSVLLILFGLKKKIAVCWFSYQFVIICQAA